MYIYVRLELFTTLSPLLATLKKIAFENIAGKGENAGNQHFLLCLQCFLHFQKKLYNSVTFILLPAILFNFDQSKILLFVKEFNNVSQFYACQRTKLSYKLSP